MEGKINRFQGQKEQDYIIRFWEYIHRQQLETKTVSLRKCQR